MIQNQDSIRFACCSYVIGLARAGKCEVWTSSFTLAEVYKRKCGDSRVGIPEKSDEIFEDFIEQDFIKKVSVDVDIGKIARRLLRRFPKIGKPQDAIHVATCLWENIDELHTFDHDNLIALNGQLDRFDRQKLKICLPPYPPTNGDAQISFLDAPQDDGKG
ncbi:MAG: PIN domain-containing protein [Alphaproteobacteria bacterium]|nr:PIN domain-containing protein [Alphaproteobacteria bacterium]